MKKTLAQRTFRVLLLCILLTALTSCSTGKTTVVPEVRQTVVNVHDTVTIKDSVRESTTTIIQQADSAMMAEFGIRLDNVERAWLVRQNSEKTAVSNTASVVIKDSVVHDSIPVPYPETVYKDRELSSWQTGMMGMGYVMVVLLGIFTVMAVPCVIIKLKSQTSKLKP